MPSDERVSLEVCALPNSLTVTRRAVRRAERFQSVLRPGRIVVFSGYDSSWMRASEDAPWVDTGPGVDLQAYWVEQIPEEAIWRAGSLRYAVLISRQLVDSLPERTIDLDETGRPVLR